jgi:hypothetical protein
MPWRGNSPTSKWPPLKNISRNRLPSKHSSSQDELFIFHFFSVERECDVVWSLLETF